MLGLRDFLLTCLVSLNGTGDYSVPLRLLPVVVHRRTHFCRRHADRGRSKHPEEPGARVADLVCSRLLIALQILGE